MSSNRRSAMVGKRSGLRTDAVAGGVHNSEKLPASTGMPTPDKQDLLTASEAIAYLGVKRPTLYTYVSRGWVRSLPCSTGLGRLYVRADLERLKSRSDGHVGQGTTTVTLGSNALSIETSLTRIDAGGPVYRGHSATSLARAGVCFESVAELLWTGDLSEKCPDWSKRAISDGHLRHLELAVDLAKRAVAHDGADGLQSLTAVRLGVAALCVQRRARMVNTRRNDLNEARELLLLSAALPAICGGSASATSLGAHSIAARLASAWKSPATRILPSRRARAIDQALVLAIDHGLDKIAVAVRMMAMAGADLYACTSAGLDALASLECEGNCMQLEHIVNDLASPTAVRRLVAINVDRGHSIPGFGHPWYAAGDPRATLLLEQATALAPDERRIRNVSALIEATRDQGAPTFEVGLVALVAALDLPFGSAATLVALGRMAGFIAHVFEQWGSA